MGLLIPLFSFADEDFLSRLSQEEKACFLRNSEEKEFSDGEIISITGQIADVMYVVKRGRIKIFDLDENGREMVFWYRLPGSAFGLSEFFSGDRRHFFAQAVDNSILYCMKRGVFDRIACEFPRIPIVLLANLGSRLDQIWTIMKNVLFLPCAPRFADLLLRLSGIYGTEEPNQTSVFHRFTQEELANMIGCTRQTISELMVKFQNEGIIKRRRGIVIIVDRKKLQSLASAVQNK